MAEKLKKTTIIPESEMYLIHTPTTDEFKKVLTALFEKGFLYHAPSIKTPTNLMPSSDCSIRMIIEYYSYVLVGFTTRMRNDVEYKKPCRRIIYSTKKSFYTEAEVIEFDEFLKILPQVISFWKK